jgi:DNA-binding NtrC family response regulator
MMTAYGDVDTAVKAMSLGAYWFFQKPVDLRQVELVLDRGLKARTTEKEVVTLKARLDRKFSLGEIVGSSAALQRSIEQVRSVASSNATILLLGETGTGKELFAQMIHQASQRSKGPFMAVHCAAIPANLLESELFGHEKGAFTGANERRVGRFESADGGTLFLDEIGEIDATTQVKLLRFLETRAVERLGSHRPIALDLRLVCATNRDLQQMVKEGKFREDLYFRINQLSLKTQSLHDRGQAEIMHIAKAIISRERWTPLDPLEYFAETFEFGNVRALFNLLLRRELGEIELPIYEPKPSTNQEANA